MYFRNFEAAFAIAAKVFMSFRVFRIIDLVRSIAIVFAEEARRNYIGERCAQLKNTPKETEERGRARTKGDTRNNCDLRFGRWQSKARRVGLKRWRRISRGRRTRRRRDEKMKKKATEYDKRGKKGGSEIAGFLLFDKSLMENPANRRKLRYTRSPLACSGLVYLWECMVLTGEP